MEPWRAWTGALNSSLLKLPRSICSYATSIFICSCRCMLDRSLFAAGSFLICRCTLCISIDRSFLIIEGDAFVWTDIYASTISIYRLMMPFLFLVQSLQWKGRNF